MIFIVVKFTVRAERSSEWLSLVDDFTQSTRAEEGNVFFEWSRSVDNENEFVLVEAFRDGDAGSAHVATEHFKTAMSWMPDVVASAPKIVNVEVGQDDWGEMAEVTPRSA